MKIFDELHTTIVRATVLGACALALAISAISLATAQETTTGTITIVDDDTTIEPGGEVIDLDFTTVSAGNVSASCTSSNSFAGHLGDLDGDGYLDFWTNDHTSGGLRTHCFWTNDGDGTFTFESAVSTAVNASQGNESGGWSDILVDLTGDRLPELYMRGNETGQLVYTNTGTVGSLAFDNGTEIYHQPPTIVFFDADGDGDMDYAREGASGLYQAEVREYGTNNLLFTFEATTDSYPQLIDANDDSYPDLLYNGILWTNDGDGTFTKNATTVFSTCVDADGYGNAWMWEWDLDLDGDLDFACATPDGTPNDIAHIRNDGWPTLTAQATNITQMITDATAVEWQKGANMAGDLDNDRRIEIATGYGFVSSTIRGPLIIRHTGGTTWLAQDGSTIFDVDPQPSASSTGNAFASIGDYDLDGKQDLFMGQVDAALQLYGVGRLYRNTTVTGNRWIKFILNGTNMGAGANSQAIGAKITVYEAGTSTVRAVYRFMPTRYRDNNPPYIHIGLGDLAGDVDVEVTWPSGFEPSNKFTNLATNVSYRITYIQGGNDILAVYAPGSGW